ncbi:MAG: 4Fe-4S dicluster domain-containing protein [Dehalococcoidales bacterium]
MGKVFIYDVDACLGCYSCQIACKDEHCNNDWMPYAKPQPVWGQFWYKLDFNERGEGDKQKINWLATLCMHCDDAPCMKVCPINAITKRPDGLVIIEPAKCDGCMACVGACPYGAIYFNQDLRLAQKCTGCAHLLDRGWPIKEPRCVDNCFENLALRFGEESEFSADIAKAEVFKPENKPRVYYLNLPKKFVAGNVYTSSDKEVVIGATCTLSGAGSATTTTDVFGDFWFEGLADGTYQVKIEKDGKSVTLDADTTSRDVNLGYIDLK